MYNESSNMSSHNPQKIFSLLQLLVSPDSSSRGLNQGAAMGPSQFDLLLEHKVKKFHESLEEADSEYLKQGISCYTSLLFPDCSSSDPRWQFVKACLVTLYTLQETLNQMMEHFKNSQVKMPQLKPSQAPPLSPDTLSVGQQKIMMTILQFIVVLGIAPNLKHGVGIPLERRSEFERHISRDNTRIPETEGTYHLFSTLKVLVKCLNCPSLAALILSRHLTDILAGLLQIIHCNDTNLTKLCTGKVVEDKCYLPKQVNQSSTAGYPSCLSGPQRADDSEKVIPHNHTRSGNEHLETNLASADIGNKSLDEKLKKVEPNSKSINKNDMATGEKVLSTDNNMLATEENVLSKENNVSMIKENLMSTDQSVLSSNDMFVLSAGDLNFCQDSVEYLISKVHPPLLVREILLLQGGTVIKRAGGGTPCVQRAPAWLRKVCGSLLTEILTKPKGVLNVLQGMLGDLTGSGTSGGSDWRKCDAVAKVIACCPMQQSSLERYYRLISPQILELLHFPDKMVAKEFLRVACSTISAMSRTNLTLTKTYIIDLLLEPLMRCTQDIGQNDSLTVFVSETELSHCVEDIYNVFVSGSEPQSECTACLLCVVHPLFQLYRTIREGTSYLRKSCLEILTALLKQIDGSTGLSVLRFLTINILSDDIKDKVFRQHPHIEFSQGEKGGVTAMLTHSDRNTDLSYIETLVPAVVSLLSDFQKERLAGDFMLSMLKELTIIVTSEIKATEIKVSSKPNPEFVIEKEADHFDMLTDIQNKLIILQLLALMCERFGPSCLSNTLQILDFVKVTLERGIQVSRHAGDDMTCLFENETLTMALGLLTAVMSTALKMTDTEREKMMEMMSLLDSLSQHNPDQYIQEMTSDLRIAIATHGKVWSSKLNTLQKQADNKKVKTEERSKARKLIEEIKEDKPSRLTLGPSTSSDQAASANHTSLPNQSVSTDQQKSTNQTSLSNQTVSADQQEPTNHNSSSNQTELCDQTALSSQSVSSSDISKPTTLSAVSNKSSLKDTENVQHEYVPDSSKDAIVKSDLQVAFEELCDPLLPVRGHALISLCKLVKRKDPETLGKQQVVLEIFLENIQHLDSYIYLAAVNGLVAMANIYPDVVVPQLVEEFVGSKVQLEEEGKRGAETRIKIGECLVQTSKGLGDVSPRYRDILLHAFLRATHDDDDLVRASSLSNLGELCQVLRFSLGNNTQEVFTCCSTLLKSDKSAEVRKSACVMITLLLRGLGKEIFTVLDTVLRDLYRLLKLILTTEKDHAVLNQATSSYQELDHIMKEFLFPKQSLQKKIRVLDTD